jgi:hypothetical protein
MSLARRFKRQNYAPKVVEAAKGHVGPGKLLVADVFHDEWCRFLKGGDCDCNPDVRVSDTQWPEEPK